MTPPAGPQLPSKPGNLTMGWDVPETPAASQATSPSQLAAKAAGPQLPQKPGALTMGWDAQPDPPAAAPGPKQPQQPGALTMGWEVPEEPGQSAAGPRVPSQPGALTMGWEVPEEPGQSAVTPSSLAAAAAKPEPSAKATLLGMAPIRDQVGVPTFSASQRVAQPLPATSAPSTVEISPVLQQASQAGPHQAIQANEPPSPYTPQAAPSAAYSPVHAETSRAGSNTESLDKPPRNMLPIYAVIGLVVLAGIAVAIVLLTQ